MHADACDLPFAEEAFDAVTCIDAYNYFGRDESYLGQRLLPFVRHGGLVYLAISGLACDVADFGGALPAELACSWTVEQLEYLWPRERWQRLFAAQRNVRVERIRDLSCNDEAWRDWVACDNPYAAGDRRAIEAGALAWLTTTEVVLRRLWPQARRARPPAEPPAGGPRPRGIVSSQRKTPTGRRPSAPPPRPGRRPCPREPASPTHF